MAMQLELLIGARAPALEGRKPLLDQGDGKRMAILLFDSLKSVSVAQEALTPVGQEYTYSLMSGPAIGSLATVLIADGVLDKATNV